MYTSAEINVECANGNTFTIVFNAPLNKVIGIKIPPSMPVTDTIIEHIGADCFSFLHRLPMNTPNDKKNNIDGSR